MDNGDNPAILSLEDLSQIALAAEDRSLPVALSSLANLLVVVLQLEIGIGSRNGILEAIDSVVVQSGVVATDLGADIGRLGSRGILVNALDKTVQGNLGAGGLSNAHSLQDFALGDSSLVLGLRGVHVELAPGTGSPFVARTTVSVGGTGDGDAHLRSQREAGLVDAFVGDKRLVILAVAVLDDLAVLNEVLGQCVVKDLSSFATSDVVDALPAFGQTLQQADLVGAVQNVNVPTGADIAFLVGVEVQGGEHQLQPLYAGEQTLGSVGGLGHAVKQTSDAAVVDVRERPRVVAVHEGVLCIAVQSGDRVLTLDFTVGSRVVDDRHDLGCLRTGEVAIRLELVLLAILEAVKNVEIGENVDRFGKLVVSRNVGVLLCAGDGDGAHDHDNGQNQRKNLFQILHLDFLLFKFYTSEQSPLCNLYLHLTAPPPFRQEARGVCNLTVTLGGVLLHKPPYGPPLSYTYPYIPRTETSPEAMAARVPSG